MEELLISEEIDENLVSFSKFLSPDDELLTRWNADLNKLVQDLRSKLKEDYNYTIDRHRIGGSVSKKTAIIQPDYDCILFFNEVYPPFATVIQQLVGILNGITKISKLYFTKYSIGFVFMKEVQVDLLPAINLVHKKWKMDGPGIISNQKENVLGVLRGLEPSKRVPYNSSLSETQVAFMKKQSSFVHIVVKLAKFWFKAICSDQRINIPGLKYLIELVAVYCAQKEEEGEDEDRENSSSSVTRALATLFKKLSNTNHLTIRFEDEDGDYYYMPPKRARRLTKQGCGFVLDPANPYNDILESVRSMCLLRQNGTHLAIRLLEGNARQSMNDLRNYLIKYSQNSDSYLPDWLNVLFKARVSSSVTLAKSYDFAICFTYFPNMTEYVTTMKHLENPQTSNADDMKLIENVFRIVTNIETYNNYYDDEEEYDSEEDNDDEEYSETSRSNYQDVEETMQELQDGIINFLESEAPAMHHQKNLQRIFYPWGNGPNGPSVRAYENNGHLSFKEKLRVKVSSKYQHVSVFHVPVWQGPCVVDGSDYGDEVQYICCLIVVE